MNMLLLSKELYNRPILSLRGGGMIAIAEAPILNPHNLKIIGWWCNSKLSKNRVVLLTEDIREVMAGGFAIDDHANLVEAEDLVRHKETLEINYILKGKTVKTEHQKLGKVADYCYDENYLVQKLYVEQPLVKALNISTLVIGRNQILEVTDRYILVSGPEDKQTDKLKSHQFGSKGIALDPAVITIE